MNKEESLEEIFSKIKKFLEKDENIIFALIFGSAALGKIRKDSDIDVAIYLKKPISGYEQLSLMQKLGELVGRDVDVVVLNNAPPLLKHQVLLNKKKLFVRDFSIYSNFREKVMDEYQEFLDITGWIKYLENENVEEFLTDRKE